MMEKETMAEVEVELDGSGFTEEGTVTDASATTGMKIAVSRDELVAKLGVVARAVSSRSTVQVLSGILWKPPESLMGLCARLRYPPSGPTVTTAPVSRTLPSSPSSTLPMATTRGFKEQ